MSRKTRSEAPPFADANVPVGEFATADEPDGGAAGDTGGELAAANGNGKRLTPAQERQRAERLARRPRYWVMRMASNGAPDSVVSVLTSRTRAESKLSEYARVLRLAPEALCVFRVSTPEGYRYPE